MAAIFGRLDPPRRSEVIFPRETTYTDPEDIPDEPREPKPREKPEKIGKD